MTASRRGFLSLLGGLVLGKTVGPRLLAAPAKEIWAEIPRLPPLPVENTYVPIEVVCAETLRIVDEELRFLRLARFPEFVHANYLGDYVQVRRRVRLDWCRDSDPDGFLSRLDSFDVVLLDRVSEVRLEVTDPWMCATGAPPGTLPKRLIEGFAYPLADQIIREARRERGAAESLVCAQLPADSNLGARVVTMSRPEGGLSLRCVVDQTSPRRGVGEPIPVEMEMVYSLGARITPGELVLMGTGSPSQ